MRLGGVKVGLLGPALLPARLNFGRSIARLVRCGRRWLRWGRCRGLGSGFVGGHVSLDCKWELVKVGRARWIAARSSFGFAIGECCDTAYTESDDRVGGDGIDRGTDAVYVLFTAAVNSRRRVVAASWSSVWYLLSPSQSSATPGIPRM